MRRTGALQDANNTMRQTYIFPPKQAPPPDPVRTPTSQPTAPQPTALPPDPYAQMRSQGSEGKKLSPEERDRLYRSHFAPGKIPKSRSKAEQAEIERARLAELSAEFAQVNQGRIQRNAQERHVLRLRYAQYSGVGRNTSHMQRPQSRPQQRPTSDEKDRREKFYVPQNINCSTAYKHHQQWHRRGPGGGGPGAPPPLV